MGFEPVTISCTCLPHLENVSLFVSLFMVLLGLVNLLGENNPLSVDAAGIIGMIGTVGIACLFGCGTGWAIGALINSIRKNR